MSTTLTSGPASAAAASQACEPRAYSPSSGAVVSVTGSSAGAPKP
ncbi:hypothetical protein [Nocardia harenae]|nr:hypothetical protein [Nocardia harenae]